MSDFPPPIDPSYKPKSSIVELPTEAPIEEILEILARDGGLILTNFASSAEVQQLNHDIERYIGQPRNGSYDIPIMPRETTLVSGLVGKSKVAAALCESPVLLQLQERLLAVNYTVKREGSTVNHRVDPLLHTSVSLCVGPGGPRQRLHRDDAVHGIDHSGPFDLSQVSQFGCLIAGTETTRENGATMFIPQSHLWDDVHEPRPDEVCFAEMKPGSTLIFLGSAYHGGGHNSLPDFHRVVHGLFFVRGTLRQEENQFLAIPHSVVPEMSEKMLSLLGYKKPTSTLGVVEGKDPMLDLRSVLTNVNIPGSTTS